MRVLVADGDARPSRVLPVVVAAAFVVVVRAEAVQIIFPTLRFVGGSGAVGGVAVRGLERVVVRIWFGIVVLVVAVGDVASAAEDAGVGGHPRGRVGSGGVGNARGGESGSEVREHGAHAVVETLVRGRRGVLVAARRSLGRFAGDEGASARALIRGVVARRGRPRAARLQDTLHGGRVRAHHADTDARDGVRRAEVSRQSQLVVVKRLSQRAVGRIP